MKTLLRIDSSARVNGSHSRALADHFETQWKRQNPDGKILYRDLTANPIPHISNSVIEAFYTPQEHFTTEKQAITALSDELIEELIEANDILLSTPLYNLNVPSNLKAYLDQIIRIGHTFTVNQEGEFTGLLTNKNAFITTSKGGVYKGSFMEQYDFQEPYLTAILGHMGIKVQEIFSLEGMSNPNLIDKNTIEIENKISQALKR